MAQMTEQSKEEKNRSAARRKIIFYASLSMPYAMLRSFFDE